MKIKEFKEMISKLRDDDSIDIEIWLQGYDLMYADPIDVDIEDGVLICKRRGYEQVE